MSNREDTGIYSLRTMATLRNSEHAAGWKSTSVDYQKCLTTGASKLTCSDAFSLFAFDESIMVAGERGHISIWSASTGQRLWEGRATDQEEPPTITGCKVLDSSHFLTSLADGRLQKWSISRGLAQVPTIVQPPTDQNWSPICVAQKTEHTKEITSIAVYKGGSRAITTSKDKSVKVWDTAKMQCIQSFVDHDCEVYLSEVLEDGSLVVTSGKYESDQASVMVWCPEAAELQLHTLVEPKQLTGWMETVDIARVTVPSWQHVQPLAGPGSPCSAPKAITLIAAAGLQGKVYMWKAVWDADEKANKYTLLYSKQAGAGARQSCRFSHCGAFLLLGGYMTGDLVMLESCYGQELLRVHTVQGPAACNTITTCFFLEPPLPSTPSGIVNPLRNADSSSAPTLPFSRTATFWSRYYNVPGTPGYTNNNESRSDGSGSSNSSGRWWPVRKAASDAGNSCCSVVAPAPGCSNHGAACTVLPAVFPTRLGAACSDGSVRIFELTGDSFDNGIWSDDRLKTVYDAAVSDDGTLIAVVYGDAELPELRVFNFGNGELLWEVPRTDKYGNETYSMFVQLSSTAGLVESSVGGISPMKGKVSTILDNGVVHIFDLATRSLEPQEIESGHKHDMVCMKFNKAFNRMLTTACGGDSWIGLWDLDECKQLRKFKHHNDAVFDAEFTSDGLRGVSASCDKTAAIFDIETGHVFNSFTGHESWVRCAVLSPDEKNLATCAQDHTVRIWDVDKGIQLHVINTHSKAVTSVAWVHSAWVVSTGRDGLLSAYNMQTQESLPLLIGNPVTDKDQVDSVEKLLVLPSSVAVAGPQLPALLGLTLNGRPIVLNPSPRQPSPLQVINEYSNEFSSSPERVPPWRLEHLEQLARTFPGLASLPMSLQSGDDDVGNAQNSIAQGRNVKGGSAGGRNTLRSSTQKGSSFGAPVCEMQDGDTLLHWAVRKGDVRLLRMLVTYSTAVVGAPLPANCQGETPLDLALHLSSVESVECVESLLASEVKRDKQHRRAVMKAWKQVAEEMPNQLVKFLKVVSDKDAKDTDAANTVLVPFERDKPLRTLGSQGLEVHEQEWRKGTKATGVLQPAVPSVCGLPYVATTSHRPDETYFGTLVVNNVSEALVTDIGYAVLTHKWDNFAGKVHMQYALLYLTFLALYIVTTTLDVQWNQHVSREALYGGSGGRVITRIVLQALMLMLDTVFLMVEVRSVIRRGPGRYLSGANGAWNAIEFLSSVLVWLVVLLEIAGFEEARWVMSICTVILGMRLLKIASGYEGTGIYVQIIIRIIVDLRYFLLIVLVVLLTYALSFRQVMIYLEQVGNENSISEDFHDNFSGFPVSILTVYYFLTIGISSYVTGDARFVWYLHVLLASFSFLVTIIMLNLIIAIMSDTYTVVQKHARSEWLLLKARLILEIEEDLSNDFFKDSSNSAPQWLHVLNLKRAAGIGMLSLLDSLQGVTVRQALNTDVADVKSKLVKAIKELSEQVQTIKGDVARLPEMIAAQSASAPHSPAFLAPRMGLTPHHSWAPTVPPPTRVPSMAPVAPVAGTETLAGQPPVGEIPVSRRSLGDPNQ